MHSIKSHKSRRSIDSNSEQPNPGTNPSLSPSPSFFSTLKSKAADKQALGNTAREAMRKWGVNWNTLKKEFNSDENGDLTSKLRSKFESTGNKRSNYAEVRAAVTERRVRETNAQSEEEDSSRSTSPFGGPSNNNSVGGEQMSQLAVPTLIQQTGKLSVNPTITPKKSLPSVSVTNTDADASGDIPEDEVRPVPIQAQPQAKTMSIPGIHASHRGEVMSMGYVAPQSSLLSDSMKTKNPAIQSVYRLWRNPTNAGQDDNTQTLTKETMAAPAMSEDQPSQPEVPCKPSEPVRQIPPPLPPRSTSSALTGNETQSSMLINPDKAQGRQEPAPLLTVETDEDIAITPSITTSSTSPPPLPPRRISSTV